MPKYTLRIEADVDSEGIIEAQEASLTAVKRIETASLLGNSRVVVKFYNCIPNTMLEVKK